MPYHFPKGENGARLVLRLAAQGWRGEIVGPHGSGKSTLLTALLPLVESVGRNVHAVALHDGQRSLPRGWIKKSLANRVPAEGSPALLVVDGYEQLAPWWRWRLRLRCRRTGAGLLVTAHAPTGLPTIARLAPDLQLVEHLVGELSQRISTPVSVADIVASHACHGSNVREILFDLYDRHEQRMRAMRTIAPCGT
jgi:energy-coupling factor transporter ATP-binding protein EcfA2